jgi:uncharacterized OsmC-like protein
MARATLPGGYRAAAAAQPGGCSIAGDAGRARPTEGAAVTTTTESIRNGVDTRTLFATLDAVTAQPELGTFRFRVRNRWLGGAHNRSTIQDFYAAGGEDGSRATAFELDAGEPPILIGRNEAPNPAEQLLHALAACLTTSLVYVAAARGIRLTRVESRLEGDMDVRGALGLSDEVRNGYEQVRVTFHVEGDAPPEKLRDLVERAKARSAVFDIVTNGVPVHVGVDS